MQNINYPEEPSAPKFPEAYVYSTIEATDAPVGNVEDGNEAYNPVKQVVSLQNYLNTNNNISFNISTIIVDGTDKTADINSEEFLIDSANNTTYIDTNTLPISNNTGGE